MLGKEEHLKIKTELVPVRIFIRDFEIEGNAHTKPGGYYNRLTDILNLSKTSFLPITEARYRSRRDPSAQFTPTDCLIIKAENIELLEFLERAE